MADERRIPMGIGGLRVEWVVFVALAIAALIRSFA